MGKKKISSVMPVFTKWKLIRLLIFIIVICLVFSIRKYAPSINTFGWGFALGMICMGVLTG
ncbi:MAG: hypothetical protein NC905_01675 [Candidatus Omnitrophica bacterium]|nr:hypothetical protein [Candidatus Omnitrophota bacterium]MCM8776961.1 hypothetical protein [Candidatus Omnitrophota bacterium]